MFSSRIKEMEAKGLTIAEIAEVFDEEPKGLEIFIEYSDAFVSGEKTLSLDITTKSKEAFQTVANSLK
ncbi:hypothetical protein [Photobacterium iliopiscarium]|uniref:Uncharacterized protein n=1 Tax=Photobacterium iliopiscarium TaxID=56192 RepID=A0A2T3MMN3_9GAMM|nr:hypothetical protein [Photobacterium iliopiscarium]PSV97853.1 hypothetical protein C9I88_07225 [Photobacterium iliopiscarium]